MCENPGAPFWGVNFSHVDAISGDSSHRIRLLAVLRGERNQFSHSLDRKPSSAMSEIGQEGRITSILQISAKQSQRYAGFRVRES
jgi:hypothetical protein